MGYEIKTHVSIYVFVAPSFHLQSGCRIDKSLDGNSIFSERQLVDESKFGYDKTTETVKKKLENDRATNSNRNHWRLHQRTTLAQPANS